MLVAVLALSLWIAVALGRSVWLRRALFALALCLGLRKHPPGYRRIALPPRAFVRSPAKPSWVKQETIRLKALMPPPAGCRAIAGIFNRRFAARRKTTVGKTFVCEVIRRHRYAIEVERRKIKNAKPRCVPKNLIWGIDLTGKTTLDGRT